MIELTGGNILQADAEALVNTVNCVGIMGKGIALHRLRPCRSELLCPR
jgi:O-acetyl-ADP-ribose deacetylase (regulator of RNase III)